MIYDELGMTKEEFLDFMDCMDEIDDYKTKLRKEFYILKEREEGKEYRVVFKYLKEKLPIEDIKDGKLKNINGDIMFKTEGDFFPEIIEEDGLYFISDSLYEYMKKKIKKITLKTETPVKLASEEGKRIEGYHLIVPYELDCILEGTEQYSETGELVYFEIDDFKTGNYEIFKVKDYPHLIITQKVNRLQYGGIHCSRIENYFDYEGERDRVCQKRLSGEKLDEAYEEYLRKAQLSNQEETLSQIKRICDQKAIRNAIRQGLKSRLNETSYSIQYREIKAKKFGFCLFEERYSQH